MKATTSPELLFEVRDGIGWVTINKPEQMNALTPGMLSDLRETVAHIQREPKTRVLVITGAGRAFCAGADLSCVSQLDGGSDGAALGSFLEEVQRTFNMLRELPKPVIAAVNGLTLAGGLELAMACDLVIAADTARFGDAHANFGVVPGAGGGVLLPRIVGPMFARYMLFTGAHCTAQEMRDFGLVCRVVPAGDLNAEVEAVAQQISQKSPLVLSRMKELVRDGLDQPLDSALRFERLMATHHGYSEDMREGLAAFAEKRNPRFIGR